MRPQPHCLSLHAPHSVLRASRGTPNDADPPPRGATLDAASHKGFTSRQRRCGRRTSRYPASTPSIRQHPPWSTTTSRLASCAAQLSSQLQCSCSLRWNWRVSTQIEFSYIYISQRGIQVSSGLKNHSSQFAVLDMTLTYKVCSIKWMYVQELTMELFKNISCLTLNQELSLEFHRPPSFCFCIYLKIIIYAEWNLELLSIFSVSCNRVYVHLFRIGINI